jgi:hypothetical protein
VDLRPGDLRPGDLHLADGEDLADGAYPQPAWAVG